MIDIECLKGEIFILVRAVVRENMKFLDLRRDEVVSELVDATAHLSGTLFDSNFIPHKHVNSPSFVVMDVEIICPHFLLVIPVDFLLVIPVDTVRFGRTCLRSMHTMLALSAF